MNNEEEIYEYTIVVTETRECRVHLTAKSEEEAEAMAEDMYNNGELDREFDFVDLDCRVW